MRSLTHLNAINKFHLGAALSLPNATKLSWPAGRLAGYTRQATGQRTGPRQGSINEYKQEADQSSENEKRSEAS